MNIKMGQKAISLQRARKVGRRVRFLTLAVLLAVLLASCAAGPHQERSPERPGSGLGSLAVYLTGPEERTIDLTVNLSSLEVQDEKGEWHKVLDRPVSINSLAQAGKRLVLAKKLIPAGSYQRIRFTVSRSYIVRDKEKADLMVPKEGFEYIFSFHIFSRETTPLFLNWDVANSVAGRFRLDLSFAITVKARGVASALIYVTSEASHQVTVFDRGSWHEVGTIPVGNSPRGIVLFRDRLYVANSFSHTVSIIDSTTQRLIDTINLRFGDEPQALALVGGRDLYVVNAGSNSLAIVDVNSQLVRSRIGVGNRPVNIALDESGQRAYVVNQLSGTVSVIDTISRRAVETIRVESQPYGVAVDASRGLVYISNMGSNNITVIDGITARRVGTLNVGTQVAGLVLDAAANRLYLAAPRSGEVLFYHPALKAVIISARVGTFPLNLVVDRAERRIYVVSRGSNAVTVIDQNTGRLIKTMNVGKAPYGLALREAVLE